MKSAHIARPYAKALLDFALENKQEDQVFADMQLVENTCRNSRELLAMLKSPIIRAKQKLNVINALFQDRITEISTRFLSIILQKGRDAWMPEIAAQYVAEYKKFKGIMSSELTTATGISNESREEIIRMLKEFSGKEIEMSEKTDPALIGGFVLRFEDKRYDTSVRTQLNELKSELLTK